MLGTDPRVRIFETRNNRTILGAIQWSFCCDFGYNLKNTGFSYDRDSK